MSFLTGPEGAPHWGLFSLRDSQHVADIQFRACEKYPFGAMGRYFVLCPKELLKLDKFYIYGYETYFESDRPWQMRKWLKMPLVAPLNTPGDSRSSRISYFVVGLKDGKYRVKRAHGLGDLARYHSLQKTVLEATGYDELKCEV